MSKGISIGKLDKRIKLLRPNLIPDGAGGFKPIPGSDKFVVVTTVWAEFLKPRVATLVETGAVISEMTREIKIRNRADVRKGWRIGWGNKTFDVLHTYETERDATMLVCREVVR